MPAQTPHPLECARHHLAELSRKKKRHLLGGAFLLLGFSGSNPVHENKQADPDHVDKMPVPSHRFESEVMLGRKVALDRTAQNDGKHDGAHGDVETMKAGQHEERRAVDARVHGQTEFMISVAVFFALQEDEGRTQRNGGRQT